MPNLRSQESPKRQTRRAGTLKLFRVRILWFPTAILMLWGFACGTGTEPSGDDSAATQTKSSWIDELPAKTVEATSEQQWFWAAVPDGAGAKIALVQSSTDGAGWRDGLGRPVEVPGALVHEFAGAEQVTGDGPQLIYVAGQGLVVGSCSDVDGERTCRVDWNGRTVSQGPQVSVASMESSPWRIYGGSAPGDSEMRGLEIAREGDTVWLLNAGGQVEKLARDAVRLQEIRVDWKVGDPVAAFNWAYGFRRGEVADILEENLRFLVRLEDGSQDSFFFDRLASPAS